MGFLSLLSLHPHLSLCSTPLYPLLQPYCLFAVPWTCQACSQPMAFALSVICACNIFSKISAKQMPTHSHISAQTSLYQWCFLSPCKIGISPIHSHQDYLWLISYLYFSLQHLSLLVHLFTSYIFLFIISLFLIYLFI